jgi:hypothetical protein
MKCDEEPIAARSGSAAGEVESGMASMYPARRPASATRPAGAASIPDADAQAMLRACFAQYRLKILELLRVSLSESDDLFETNSHIPDGEVEAFRSKREAWLDRFDKTLMDLFDRRLRGERRRGRRPDADASLATLRVLTAYDHERQTALKDVTRFLDRFTQRELAALDLRVDTLLPPDASHEIDNPFAVTYILDAVGASARAVYPAPRVWRPFMERVLEDLTPDINKLYISINRFLADRGVLPEIKAALRARSELRPEDDRDLLPTFSRLLADEGRAVPTDIVVPDSLSEPGAPAAFAFSEKPFASSREGGADPDQMSAAKILAGLAALAKAGAQGAVVMAPGPGGDVTPVGYAPVPGDPLAPVGHVGGAGGTPGGAPSGFPSLDPLMALGTSSPLFATLAQWQRLDLPAAIARAAPPAAPGTQEGTHVPLNLVPHIRAAIESQFANDTDRITLDVIALLFDYIFRDRSIPDPLRSLFGRLQVPIVKAALLDRSFFSDNRHPARELLDNLADAAVGAAHDDDYQAEFTALSTAVVDGICRDFEIDVEVFRAANARLRAFIDTERQQATESAAVDVAAALSAEEKETDRSHVRAFLRDRLAGIDVPFEVRSFVETIWAEHLTSLRQQHGAESEAWYGGVRTLDDMLWSIVAKERSSQKARLTKMIPALIGSLRRASVAQQVPPERAKAFFEALYQLHMAAIKPAPGVTVVMGDEAPPTISPTMPASAVVANVHDFVSEMAVGTWLSFAKEGRTINARLTWVSPLRTKYLFTSRSKARAFVYTPEELAYEFGAGKINLVVEPVPLFDRAVSAALDTLATRQPAGAAKP